jgi:hypothetical protein
MVIAAIHMCAHSKEVMAVAINASAMKHGMTRDIAIAKERGKMMCKEKKRGDE